VRCAGPTSPDARMVAVIPILCQPIRSQQDMRTRDRLVQGESVVDKIEILTTCRMSLDARPPLGMHRPSSQWDWRTDSRELGPDATGDTPQLGPGGTPHSADGGGGERFRRETEW